MFSSHVSCMVSRFTFQLSFIQNHCHGATDLGITCWALYIKLIIKIEIRTIISKKMLSLKFICLLGLLWVEFIRRVPICCQNLICDVKILIYLLNLLSDNFLASGENVIWCFALNFGEATTGNHSLHVGGWFYIVRETIKITIIIIISIIIVSSSSLLSSSSFTSTYSLEQNMVVFKSLVFLPQARGQHNWNPNTKKHGMGLSTWTFTISVKMH